MSSTSSPDEDTIKQKQHIPPTLNLIYKSPGFCGPYPDYSNGRTQEKISGDGCTPIVKISPTLVVKYGPHVKTTEAESLLFVEKRAPGIPAPRVCAYYTIGPCDKGPLNPGSVYDTYIIMTFVEGRRLDEAWNDLDESQKTSLAAQLRAHMEELRSISQDNELFIGSIANGPLGDRIFLYNSTQGPFANEQEFNAELVAVHEERFANAHIRLLLEGALAQNRHKIVLTHGDLQGRNIMVDGDRLTGIIDWETCGWYPEYWEFAKCFGVFGWAKDWPEFVSQILEPYFCQWVVYHIATRYVY